MECDGTPRPDQPVTIKNAHISLVRVPRPFPSHRVESLSVVAEKFIRGKEITIQNGDGLCVAASGTKNGKRIIAEKCKAGSSKQQWQIGPM